MPRPKKHAAASKNNGAKSAKKLTKKRVPIFCAGGGVGTKKEAYVIEYGPKLPKGYYYQNELADVIHCVMHRKRVHFDASPSTQPPLDKEALRAQRRAEFRVAKEKALNMLKKLNDDPDAKVRTLRSLAKQCDIPHKC